MTAGQIQAAVLHGLGETPRYESFPAPVAGDGDAVVTVAAAALEPSDRLMAKGVHYAPDASPRVAGLDGVGRLDDGTRVAFFLSERPYGGMAEQTLVRRGAWFAVPDGADDVTAAAVLNPGMAAWKSVVWGARWRPGRRCSCSARIPAMALRASPVALTGSGIDGPPPLTASAAAYDDLLRQLSTGELMLDVDRVPPADVEWTWTRDGTDRRTVFVP